MIRRFLNIMMLVNEEKCIGCGLCVKDCLLGCIKIKEKHKKNYNVKVLQ